LIAAEASAALAADRARALQLVPVSRETLGRLDRLAELLLEWQQTRNLIAASTIPTIWTRHIADSLQLLELAPGAKIWVDIGSGGGFPGLVMACALKERPGAEVHLVESIGKKCAFLQAVVDDLKLPATVHCERAETFIPAFPRAPHVVTARAVAALPKLLAMVFPLLKKGAVGLFPKGQDVGAELTAASKYWNIGHNLMPSRTDPQARIVVVKSLESRKPASKARRRAR
jgi:16S rRNA (guanine527-N7)-methyltransferase